MSKLPDAPETPWDDDGELLVGTYSGELSELPIDERYSRFERIRAQKRWLWTGVMTPEIAVGLAIVRTGYAANVFCWVFDRESGEFLQDVSRVLPRPAVDVTATPKSEDLIARYRGVVEGITVTRTQGTQWEIDGNAGDANLDLRITELATPSTAICRAGERLNVTRKLALARAEGTVRVGTRRIDIKGGFAMLDHSHGMLSGETVWQWAIGNGSFDDDESPVGFNAVASFNDSLENTLWLGDEPEFAGAVTFEIPEDQRDTWRIHNDRIDLSMQPEGLRSQELDLAVVASDYVQPLGVWRGTIDGRAATLQGVAELHRSVW